MPNVVTPSPQCQAHCVIGQLADVVEVSVTVTLTGDRLLAGDVEDVKPALGTEHGAGVGVGVGAGVGVGVGEAVGSGVGVGVGETGNDSICPVVDDENMIVCPPKIAAMTGVIRWKLPVAVTVTVLP